MKGKYTKIIDNINEYADRGRREGLLFKYTEDDYLDGRHITIDGQKLINFGSCSYLGIEIDERLKEAGIEAIRRYGAQFSSSRTFVSLGIYKELENNFERIFGAPVLLSPTVTLGHMAVFSIIIDGYDAVIFDQQAHVSMQEQLYKVKHFGAHTTVVKHNNLDHLEEKIIELQERHEKVWYVADGVYSMYGDLPPYDRIKELLDKYPKLHFYVDDAHGMAWAGKHGQGYTMSKIGLHERMVLATSLAKAFGSCGGVFVFPNKELYHRVKTWGGPLTFSGPQQPAVIGASVAATRLLLSDEITQLQETLQEKINFFQQLIGDSGLPFVAFDHESPIFFLGVGVPSVVYKLAKCLLREGIYVNISTYPAVPERCGGLRITITNHINHHDMRLLIDAVKKYLPKVLLEESYTLEKVYRNFRNVPIQKVDTTLTDFVPSTSSKLRIECHKSYKTIEEHLWNSLLNDDVSYEWQDLRVFENSFKENVKKEENWDFHYFLVFDGEEPILATLFTSGLFKDDMILSSEVSKKIEEKRKESPHFLTNKMLMMGTPMSYGTHLYLDQSNDNWKQAMKLLFDELYKLQQQQSINTIFLRDFDECNTELNNFLIEEGFVKANIPSNYTIDVNSSIEAYIKSLKSKKRWNLKRDVLDNEHSFKVEIKKHFIDDVYDLYCLYANVAQGSTELNTFQLPFVFFENMISAKNAEVLTLSIPVDGQYKVIAVGFNLISNGFYCPLIIGMDYNYSKEYKVYKQMLYQSIKRACELDTTKIYLGLTAGQAKRNIGATEVSRVGFVQQSDDYNQKVIQQISEA